MRAQVYARVCTRVQVNMCVHVCVRVCTHVHVCMCMHVVSSTSSTESGGNSARPVLFPRDIFHKLGLSVKPLSAHYNNYSHVFAYRTLTKPRHPFGKSGVQGRTLHGHDTQRAPAGGLRSDVGSHTPPGGLPGQARERCPRLTGPDRCREVPPWAWSRLARSPEAGRRASTRKDAQEGTPLHASSQASSVSGRLRQTLGGPHYCRLCLCSDKHFLRENHIFSSPRLNLHLSNTQLLEAFRTVTVGSAAFTKGGRGCHGGSSVNAPIIDSRNDSRTQLRAITIITHP